jgi:hypothetical protein
VLADATSVFMVKAGRSGKLMHDALADWLELHRLLGLGNDPERVGNFDYRGGATWLSAEYDLSWTNHATEDVAAAAAPKWRGAPIKLASEAQREEIVAQAKVPRARQYRWQAVLVERNGTTCRLRCAESFPQTPPAPAPHPPPTSRIATLERAPFAVPSRLDAVTLPALDTP